MSKIRDRPGQKVTISAAPDTASRCPGRPRGCSRLCFPRHICADHVRVLWRTAATTSEAGL